MARRPPNAVALMSMHPRFAQLIIRGEKRVEFRKTRFQRPVDQVIVYATNPVKAVVGFFEVKGVIYDDVHNLWREYGAEGQIDWVGFSRYYADRMRGVAIQIGKVTPLNQPALLPEIGENLMAPQSFTYLTGQALSRFKRLVSLRLTSE